MKIIIGDQIKTKEYKPAEWIEWMKWKDECEEDQKQE